jgi:hypothetical protein
LIAYHPEKFSARASFSKKNLSSDGRFERPFSFMAMESKLQTQKKAITRMKTKILQKAFLTLTAPKNRGCVR